MSNFGNFDFRGNPLSKGELLAMSMASDKQVAKQNALQVVKQDMPLKRHEQLPSTKGGQVSLMTYNILSHHYVRWESCPWTAFSHCTDEVIDWSQRQKHVLSTVLSANADVVCLQEMGLEAARDGDPQMPEWTKCWEEAGYKCILQDDKKRSKGQLTANATLFKSDRFELVDAKHQSRSLILWLQKGTVLYAICNVHLEGNPEKHKERYNQLQSTLKHVTGHTKAAHVIIAGDFNSDIAGLLADLVGEGTPHNLQDVFPACDGPSLGAVTWAEPEKTASVDHVLLDSTLRVVRRRYVLDGDEEYQEVLRTGLPSGEHPSDHLPLALVVEPITGPINISAATSAKPSVTNEVPPESEREELVKRYAEILSKAPPANKGKPSPEELQLLKQHAKEKKEFLEGLPKAHALWVQQQSKQKK